MAKFGMAVLAAAFAFAAPAMAQDMTVEPGFVKGTVKNAAGQPLAGVVVYMDGYDDNNVQYTTKEDGTYTMRLPPGAYKAMAWLETKWEGQKFHLDLKPDTTDTLNSVDGAVRTFTLVLTGEKLAPDMGVYGAFLYTQLDSGDYYVEDQDNITYTLTPVGPLIDGSTGEVIVRKGGAPRTEEYGKILDIPIGKYAITGIYQPPGMKPQTLRFKNSWGRNPSAAPFEDKIEFVISAEGNYCSNCASVTIEALKQPEPQ